MGAQGDMGMDRDPLMSQVEDAATIAALARLSPMEYDRVRKAEAAKLGVRPETLDRQVNGTRRLEVDTSDVDGFSLHEDGIGLAFAERFKKKLRYCHTTGGWFQWDGAIWRREHTKLAFAWARAICRELAEQASVEEKERTAIAKAATASAVERFAQSDRELAVTFDIWDRDINLLGTPGGVVDLSAGELHRGEPEDHITRCTSVTPALPSTPHPQWSQFLTDATKGDTDLQDFLQRLAGYLLTGDVTEEMLAFVYGKGGNGKGVFLGAITAILNTYAVAVPIEVFTAGSRLNLEYYRAQMAGARLVTASETEAGATWAESQIKEMTGNEAPLSARQPYGQPFTYRPQFKIVLVGNHAPRLKGRTPAMERRLRVLPFTNAPANPDRGLKDRLVAEYPAILRWMIEGCLKWRAKGLGTSTAIAAATGEYFEQQDSFSRWIEERCIVDASLSCKPGLLHADHTSWAKANGEDVTTSNEFAEMIDRRDGLKRVKSNSVRLVKGIGLKGDDRYGD